MPETTRVTLSWVKFRHDIQSSKIYLFNDHLCNAVSTVKYVRFGTQIDQRDLYFAAVIGINGSGGIYQSDAMVDGQTAAGSDLSFISLRQSDGETGGN